MSERLSRSLTFIGLLGFGFNIMIGSGIFFLPGEAMAIMGPASVLAVLAALLVAALLVFCFAELSSQFSETGGPILYTHATLGPAAAFGVGWLGYLARVSSNAALVVIFATSAVSAFPALGGSEPVLIAGFLAFLLALNLGNVASNSRVMDVVLVLKVIPLLVFLGWGAFHIDPGEFTPFAPQGVGRLGETTLVIFFAVVGFEMMTVVAGEARDPKQNIPRALFIVVLTSGALLLSVFVVLIGVYPNAALSESPVSDAALSFMGPAGRFIAIGILLSVIGVNMSCALATPRYLYAMSLEGHLPPVFKRVSSKAHIPHVAVLVSFALTYALTIGNTYVVLAVLSSIARIGQYIMSCIALLILRHRKRPEEIQYRAPAGHLMAATALLICVWLLVSAEGSHLMWSLIALLGGYVLFFANRFLVQGTGR